MKTAIVYDWLNVKIGGGEQTVFEIAKLYPEADIYCLVYNPKKFDEFLGKRNIITSRLNKFPKFMRTRPNLLLPFIKKSVDKFDFSGYDLIISVSSAWVKNITTPKDACHISYCYSPARMIWDSWPAYLDAQKIGPFRVGPVSKFFITRTVSKLRLWDYYHSRGVYEFVAISKYILKRINKYYHRTSKLVYPPVPQFDLAVNTKDSDYYLCVSSLSRYKNIDIVIESFKKTNKALTIAGDGPDRERLERIAGSSGNIKFVGRVSEEEKLNLLAQARAFVFPSLEDFGIAPVEALSAGTPVIALKGGGLLETVSAGKTGVFFNEPTSDSLNQAIEKFEKLSFNPKLIHSSAQKYSQANFDKNFRTTIELIYNRWQHEHKS